MEIANRVFSVGVRDWNRRLFDAFVPLPSGTSYNSFLVRGKQKTALIDTVNPGFEIELLSHIKNVCPVNQIDYLIMNHAEPDHGGAIPVIMKESQAFLLASEKGSAMAHEYYKVPKERIRIVKEGEGIELGDKTLRFIEAPWLHWPETMFTYLVEDKILFPCDFFGSHTAYPVYDTESDDLIPTAKKYFGEIMMPFREAGRKALEKLKAYEITMIAPSHGPLYTHPQVILEQYTKWISGECRKKALVIYVSMWGSTEKLAHSMVQTLMSQGVEVVLYNLASCDMGHLVQDLVDSKTVVMGAPSFLGSLHPLALNALALLRALRPPFSYTAFLTSYGWTSSSQAAVDLLSGKEMIGIVEVKGIPKDDDFQKVSELAREVATRTLHEEKKNGENNT